MNSSENPSVVLLTPPFQMTLLWWGAASQAMQACWGVHKVASICVDRLGRASLSVGLSALWPASVASNVPASPATPPLLPAPEHPITPHPSPDPIPPGINDPPPIEVPPPIQEPPVMPPPVAEATHAVFGDGEPDPDGSPEQPKPDRPQGPREDEAAEESSPQTAAGASAPLSKPALETAPRDEEGPLVSEADPTSNAG